MIEIPTGRLMFAILALSAVATAQPSPQESPAAPIQNDTTTSGERVQQPQPQPYPASPPPATPGAQGTAQAPPAQTTPQPQPVYSPYGSQQPYTAPSAGRAREANDPNNQSGNRPAAEPYGAGNIEGEPSSKFEMPAWSVRVDPFNWLLAGRLGLELESQIWKFISVEMVPVFVVNDQPPYLNLGLSGVPDTLYQKSAGIGALAGTSVGLGFWLNGKPMEGYVLRAELTDYAITYDAHDSAGQIDKFKYVERYFQALFGSHSKWGAFTLAGTFGFGTALKKVQRCFAENSVPSEATAMTSGCANGKRADIAVTRDGVTAPLNPWTYPIDLVARISLGVAF